MRNHGFTLLELLVVVVIVGILASVAMPRYVKTLESSRAAEAYANLNAIRQAEWVFFSKYNEFTAVLNDLNIENPNAIPVAPGGNRYFSYQVTSVDPLSIRAKRQNGPYASQYIDMDANGNIDESGWLNDGP